MIRIKTFAGTAAEVEEAFNAWPGPPIGYGLMQQGGLTLAQDAASGTVSITLIMGQQAVPAMPDLKSREIH